MDLYPLCTKALKPIHNFNSLITKFLNYIVNFLDMRISLYVRVSGGAKLLP